MTIKIWIRNLCCASVTLLQATVAQAEILTFSADDVVSATRIPKIMNYTTGVDGAGRPHVLAQLSFANECLRDVGVSAEIVSTESVITTAYLMLHPGKSERGCPDIFSPVSQRLAILLPAELAGRKIAMPGWPWRNNMLAGQEMSKTGSALENFDELIEARPPHVGFPSAKIESVKTTKTGRGYSIFGAIALNRDCALNELNTAVREAPDESGTPTGYAVWFTAPRRCVTSSPDRAFEFQIDLPRRGSNRVIAILNEHPVRAHSVPN